MLARALDARVPAAWVAGEEVYGADPGLRSDLEKRETGYMLAVACRHQFSIGLRTSRAEELGGHLPRAAWQQYSAGPGTKGHRYYDWAWVATDPGRAVLDEFWPDALARLKQAVEIDHPRGDDPQP
jgi:hypothetical protein